MASGVRVFLRPAEALPWAGARALCGPQAAREADAETLVQGPGRGLSGRLGGGVREGCRRDPVQRRVG